MMKKFVDVLKEYKNKYMVAETWGSIDDLLLLYKTIGWKWYQPFNFSLITLPWIAEPHKEYIDMYDKTLGNHYLPCWVLGSHDKSRVATRIGKKQARVGAILQLTLRGLPFIYYGEEIGMIDTKIPRSKIVDPFEIKSPGLGLGRDPARTPMQWDNSTNSGFSEAEPWLPVNKLAPTVNVEAQKKDPHSFYHLYKKLIELDKTNDAIREGEYIPLPIPAKNVYAFLRKVKKNKVLILLNLSRRNKKIKMNYKGTILLDTHLQEIGKRIDLKNYLLPKDEGYIIQI
jgi:alpha-glucosidase